MVQKIAFTVTLIEVVLGKIQYEVKASYESPKNKIKEKKTAVTLMPKVYREYVL